MCACAHITIKLKIGMTQDTPNPHIHGYALHSRLLKIGEEKMFSVMVLSVAIFLRSTFLTGITVNVVTSKKQ